MLSIRHRFPQPAVASRTRAEPRATRYKPCLLLTPRTVSQMKDTGALPVASTRSSHSAGSPRPLRLFRT